MCKTLGTFLVRFVSMLTYSSGYIAALVVLIIVLLVTFDVTLRYLFNAPTKIADEISGYLLVCITYVGLAYVARRGGHIRIDVIHRLLPQKVKDFLDIVTTSVGMVLIVLFLVKSSIYAFTSYKGDIVANTVLMTPLWIPQMVVVIGLGILALALILEIFNKVRAL